MLPKQILKNLGRELPQIWTQIKSFRSGKGCDLPNWADWCYIPIAAGYAISTQGGIPNTNLFNSLLNPAVITAAATWRVSQGVYRFDADLYSSLTNQSLDGNIPCEVLKRLPEWCVYIETMGATFGETPIEGFWVHLEDDVNDGRMELRFVFLGNDVNIPVPIHLGDWSLEEGLKRMMEESKRQSKLIGYNNVNLTEMDISSYLVPFIQLVLYLCAENVDMPNLPKHPSTRIRMGGQVDAPKEPKLWNVGERIGSNIRKYRNSEIDAYNSKSVSQGKESTNLRPHLRRAHWHHFWTGPKDSNERKLILRWLPPIPINIDENQENPAVIHKINTQEKI